MIGCTKDQQDQQDNVQQHTMERQAELDAPLVRVPTETLRRSSRTDMRLADAVFGYSANLASKATAEGAERTLVQVREKLQNLRSRLGQTHAQEVSALQELVARAKHLRNTTSTSRNGSKLSEAVKSENARVRTDVLLADFLLRLGFHRSVDALVEGGTTTNKEEEEEEEEEGKVPLGLLTDVGLFRQMREVEDSLAERSCTLALKWVAENRPSLDKANCPLEFLLRLQEYIEMVREKKLKDALDYCRKFIYPFRDRHMHAVSQAAALISFSPETKLPEFRSLFDTSRWDILINEFRLANCQLNGLTLRPQLIIALQAGITALKTPTCTKNIRDAVKSHLSQRTDEIEDDIMSMTKSNSHSNSNSKRNVISEYMKGKQPTHINFPPHTSFEESNAEDSPTSVSSANNQRKRKARTSQDSQTDEHYNENSGGKPAKQGVSSPNSSSSTTTPTTPSPAMDNGIITRASSPEQISTLRLDDDTDEEAELEDELNNLQNRKHLSECPVCCDPLTFGILSENLPNAHHVNSFMVDPKTGEQMNEDNPPMVLPNGRLISRNTLETQQRGGRVQCPSTGAIFPVTAVKRVFIM